MIAITVCLVFPAFSNVVFGSNILMATSIPSPSHKIFNFALAEGLVKAGHNVTFLAPGELKHLGKGLKNYHPIHIEGINEYVLSYINLENMESASILENLYIYYDYDYFSCEYIYQTELQTILNYPDDFKFDAIIFDVTCGQCLLPLIKRFNYPPTIGITAYLLPTYASFNFGNHLQPAYLPGVIMGYQENMNFFQRLVNFFTLNLDLFLRHTHLDVKMEALIHKTFGKEMDKLADLEQHISLLLCNLNFAFHRPEPLSPNIIPVGGLHLKPTKPLPKDIQSIMDNATDGVILFALGTNVRSDKLREDKKQALLEAFRKIKQTVLWKFESELEGLPKNVIIRKWLPQTDVLAHPNIKLFIGHGGGLSTLEAAYFGVPIIGIPFMVDQYLNVNLMVDKKLALGLQYSTITAEKVLSSINEILTNSIYTENIKEVSKMMKDQPETPLERAIFWVEFSIKHNGTHFLNTAARRLPFYISNCLDIYLFIICSLILVVILLGIFLKFIKRCITRPTKVKQQ